MDVNTLGDVIEAHEVALTYGGVAGIRDIASIESAIGRPYTGYYRRIHQKAAALAESLARNHGFTDGNKRTAFLILDLFIYGSAYVLTGLKGDPYDELEEFILQIADIHPPIEEITEWFRVRLRRA